jgi:pimeloyl-ACP methyl ester carboxylesterase
MNQAKINGVELQYEITGSGEPLLLISTGPIADSFFPFVAQKPLADRCRLIRYRQRRSGDGSPVTFADHAVDAAALLAHLGIARAHVAGHSTGAAVALQLAVDRPEVVHSLMLLEPPLMTVPSAAAFFESVGPAVASYQAGDREGAMAKFLSAVCSLSWPACQTVLEKYIPGSAARALSDSDNFFGSYLPALSGWRFGAEQAAAIVQPVLSVVGMDTNQLFIESNDLLHTWFPQLEECKIDRVAHLLHMQDPEPVARCVVDFCARHPLSRGAEDRVKLVSRQPADNTLPSA